MRLGRASPDPGFGVAIEVLGGDPGHVGNVVIIGQRLSREGFAPEDAPPALNQIEPGRSHRNEGVLDARMGFQPLPDGATGVAGEVIGNQVEVPRADRYGPASGATPDSRWYCGSEPSGSAPARRGRERPVDPDLLRSRGRSSAAP